MKNFYIQNPFASVLFCALAYRPNITWAAEPTLLLVLQSTVETLYAANAELMYSAVRIGGIPCSALPWRWGYGWPECG